MKVDYFPKINGFSRGPNLYQIMSYLIMIGQIICFSYIMVPNLHIAWQIPLSIFFYISFVITFIAGVIVTKSDPTDITVINEKKCRREGLAYDSTIFDFHCQFCDSSVSDKSKHCRQCNRCVQDFDHHCKWVNNCIARLNYKNFMVMISAVLASTCTFTLTGILYIVDFYIQGIGFLKHDFLLTLNNNSTETSKTIAIIVFTIANFLLFVLDLRLVGFHVYLIRNKMSTYDYIMKLKERPLLDGVKKNRPKKKKNNKVAPVENIGSSNDVSPVIANPVEEESKVEVKKPEKNIFPEIKKSNLLKDNGPDMNTVNMLVNGGCTDVEVDPNALTRTISIDSSHKGMMSSNIDPLSPSTNMLLSKRGYVGKFSSDEKTDAGDTAIGSTQTIKHNHDSIHPLQHQINVINFDEKQDTPDTGNRSFEPSSPKSPYKSYANNLFNSPEHEPQDFRLQTE